MWGQGAGPSEKLFDGKLKALAVAGLNGLGGHLVFKRRERRRRAGARGPDCPLVSTRRGRPSATDPVGNASRPRPGRGMSENYGQRWAVTGNKTAGQSEYWLF